jgi:DNA repair exonuclease SbcCD ATPase subunit
MQQQEFLQTLSTSLDNSRDNSAEVGTRSSQLTEIFKKIEENSRTFREPAGKAALESQNAELASLANSSLFHGPKSNQRISDQLGELRDLITNSQEMSQRLAGLIEALSEQARQQAAERIELDRERDQINSWRNREQLSLNRKAAHWARFAFAVSFLGLVVGFARPSLQPPQPAPFVASAGVNELKPTLERIEKRLSKMERAKTRVVRPKARVVRSKARGTRTRR